MSNNSNRCEAENAAGVCNERREFLVKSTAIAGGLFLSLAGLKSAKAQTANGKPANTQNADEAVLKIDAASPLNKVGGSMTIETTAGKIIVVRTDAATFKAFSAICTHKGGPINYDEKTQQLSCPWHNSRFDLTGAVVKGPAKQSLASYASESAIVVNLKK